MVGFWKYWRKYCRAENNPTSPEESVVVKGKAAKLQSTWIGFIGIGAFASASMFTGNFVDIDGTNGILSFGQPFTAKPTKLTGYYKYTPVNIDYMEQWDSKVDPDLKSGDSDQCIIYIALCTKNYEIRTNPKVANCLTLTMLLSLLMVN